MKKIAILMILALAISLYAVTADVSPGRATFTETDEGQYAVTAGDTLQATGGNIFTADIDSNVSTVRWAGITGNVSGNLVLGDVNNNSLYVWSGTESLYVYATENTQTIDWAGGLSAAASGSVTTQFTWLATSASVNDDYLDTFTTTTGTLSSNIFGSIATVPNMFSEDGAGASATWETMALEDSGNQVVFAGTVVDAGAQNYKDVASQFQMIIPELGGQGNEGATDWDLWIELQ